MNRIVTGLYKHYSGKPYSVIGLARSTSNPEKQFVVYEQLYDSKLKGSNIDLPKGSLWIRDFDEFCSYVDDNKMVKRFMKK